MKEKGPHSTTSVNKGVNGGSTMGGGSPKDTSMGKDLGRDATNVITVCGSNPKEYSPSATSFSKNR